MSNLRHFFTGATSLLAFAILGTAAQAQILVNGNFEDDVMPNFGNNVNIASVTGWTLASGTRPNLVRVDGPGGQANWYTSGPASDGTMAGAGVIRQYFDTRGRGAFYQTFTSPCTRRVNFGGSFSHRGGRATGSISLRNGAGVSGSVIGQSQPVTLSGGNTVDQTWVTANGSATVQQGQTFSLVITMDNNMNFDEAYVNPQRLQCVVELEAELEDPAIVFDPFPPVPSGEHYQCYMLQKGDDIKAENITIRDQFGRSNVVLGRPVMMCNPSMKIHKDKTFKIQNEERHLVCYNYVKQDRPKSQNLRINTQFGKDEVVSTRREMFCAPSGKNHIK